MTTKSNVEKVKAFFQGERFTAWYNTCIKLDDKIDGFDFPTLAAAPPWMKSTVGSYASVLRALANPQDDSNEVDTTHNLAPPRPTKRRAVQLEFANSAEFPAMATKAAAPPVAQNPNTGSTASTPSLVTTATNSTSFEEKLAALDKRLTDQMQTFNTNTEVKMDQLIVRFETQLNGLMTTMHNVLNRLEAQNVTIPPSPSTGLKNTGIPSSIASVVENNSQDGAPAK
jgi:hypothetical protein